MNVAAMKLPDALLVRYYREQKIDLISQVSEESESRDITVTLIDGCQERWKYLVDLGWVPDLS